MTEEVTTTQDDEMSGMMTPEELAMWKKLQAKRKAMTKQMGSIKEVLFKALTQNFASSIVRAKKDIVTISTKEKYVDGNAYSISFGVEQEESENSDELDTNELAVRILDENIGNLEPIMGIANNVKLSGTYEGKKLFWIIRKKVGKED
ncbi:MAG: hypothetical protein US52_C0053G0012 [candidate division WS6 bacterium GW2011_GWA2_37_6]|uniref:Uncharacterized protein n=1 Tax=candidate division WS6 bacterium GW2011_GWA2_37_6 TaxID=1619087 RepID=A0A0G0JCW5_9BACT|nr:MAG: hypothetical protein US52_C0053G0012 [candidate division WS6 bacterium GW2011_GWA2_37_6]